MQKGDYELASPCSMCDLPQSSLEPVLVEEAQNLGAGFRFSTELVSFHQDTDHVLVTVRNRVSGETYTVSTQYLIGADGARSVVLEALNIPVIGCQHGEALNVHIKADLSKYIAHRPGSLTWALNTDGPTGLVAGAFRMVKPWNEFVVIIHSAIKPTEETLRAYLYQLIGDDSIGIDILSSFPWTINEQCAERWQDRRVLCIGDATHRHPPAYGLGSNTCISDAFNLSWKLAYVLKGWASPSLLETLTSERKPVGDEVVQRANEGIHAHQRLWSLLGSDSESRKKINDSLRSDGAEGDQKRSELRVTIQALENEAHSLGVQMNQIYSSVSAAIAIETGDTAPDFTQVNDTRVVKVSTYPGYHLPHLWLVANSQSSRVSTLDLCGQGHFTLLTGIGGGPWVTAAENLSRTSEGVQIRAYTIGFGCQYLDCYGDWFKVRGVSEAGAVLVRPDHFVAWRCQGLVEEPATKLCEVMRAVLGGKGSS